MTFLLFFGSVVTFLLGAIITAGAKSAIHEILGACAFISSAIQFSGGAITYTLNRLAGRIEGMGTRVMPAPALEQPEIDPVPLDEPIPQQPPPAARSWVEEAREQRRLEQGAGQ